MSEEKRQQVIALGRLGWSLRRIEKETGVRRETAGGYIRAAGIGLRPQGRWGRGAPVDPTSPAKPGGFGANSAPDRPPTGTGSADESPATPEAAGSKPAKEVSPDFGAEFEPDLTAPEAAPATERLAAPEAPGSKPAKETSPDSTPDRSASASSCEAHRDFIELSLSKGRNAKAIYQDLVDEYGFRSRYQSVKRFVRQLKASTGQQACPVIVTAPGEEAQVDYGSGPMVRDPKSGGYRRTRLFVLTLGYSRKAVHLLTFDSNTRTWAALHEQAFRRLGGATHTVVLDNLGEGVLKPDLYDPALNPLYRDTLAHYGAVALPCRVRHPDRKGKVERGVGHAKNTPLKGLRFESLAEAQAYLDRWEQNWADTRIHGTTKRQVAVMFNEEKSTLVPLPLEPFRTYQFGERRVNLDGCVEVEAAYYSTPPGWIGRPVKVQWDDRTVRVLDPRSGQLLREHLRQQRGRHRIADDDRPAKTPRTTQQLLVRCAKLGHHAGSLAEQTYNRDGVVSIRRIQGLLGLARTHGAALTDDGCRVALEVGLPANPYRFVRTWLERKPQLTLRQVDPIIRQLTLYRDFIDNATEENKPE